MSELFELKDDAEVLFEIEGNKIVDYNVNVSEDCFILDWVGSKGFGSFVYLPKENRLNTEFIGREFCIKFIEEIFNHCDVEYNEEE